LKRIIGTGAFLAVMLAGCSQSANSQPDQIEKSEMTFTEEHYAEEQIASSPRFASEANYQAIEPSDSAEPLDSQYTDKQLAEMPSSEAHGDETDRSVPLGQTLEKGTEDQTDGPLQNHRIVSYYGHPHSKSMGILGEYSPEVLMDKLKEQTKAYSELDPDRPAIPAVELITTVAQRSPGEEGHYVHATPDEEIEKYAKLAKENDALLILDIQLGQDTIMNQVKSIEKYLKLPYVHLAIDTEFHVQEGQIPGVNLGRVDGENVQKAIDYVSNLTEENGLPDKVVIVHQFADIILTNKDAIQPTSNVEVVLNNDGHGIAALKRSGYHQLVHNQPIQYGGFKVFYKKDEPVMTPKDVLELDPAPAFVNYQ
jgi:hypothetical protein